MCFLFQVRPARLFTIGVCLLVAVGNGCGGGGPKTGQVAGTVTLDGAPIGDCVVNFEDPVKGRGGSARVTAGGFQFESPLEVGDYKVSIQPPPPPAPTAPPPSTTPTAIPAKYRQVASSGFSATVKPGSNKFEFQLTK